MKKLFRFVSLSGILLFLWGAAATLTLAAPTSPAIKNSSPETPLSAALPPHRPLLQSNPTLTVAKTADPQPVEAGQVITYTVVISNNDTGNATGVTLSDTITGVISLIAGSVLITPGTAGGVTGTQPIIAHSITVAAQSLVTVTYKVSVARPLTNGLVITNVAAVTSTQISTPATSLITSSVHSAPILSLRKTAADVNGGQLEPGDTVTYTLVVSNTGNAVAHTVAASDTLPANTSYVSGSIQGGDRNGFDGTVLTWTINTLAPGASNAVTQTYAVTITPPLSANTRITNTASVTSAEVSTPVANAIILTVSNAAPIASAASFTTAEDTPFSDSLSASDANNDVLTYSVSVAPAHGTVNITNAAAGDFVYTPTANYNGQDVFTFLVSDTGGLSDTALVTLTISAVNDAPVLDSIGDKNVDEESVLTFTAVASDVDSSDTLTFTLNNAPAGATISATTGLFSWTPTEAQGAGSYTFTVIVNDNGSPVLSDSETITVAVNEVNLPPVLSAIGDKNIDEQRVLTFTATATDPDLPANTLTYTLRNAPAGAILNSSSGLFQWMPSEDQGPGSYTATIIVSDNASPVLTDSETITITVNEVNRPPVLDSIGNKNIDEQQALTFTAVATDSDRPTLNTLIFSLSNAPTGATISATTGLFSWTPTEAQGAGNYTFTVIVSDDGSPVLTDSETITVAVNEVNLPPVLNPVGNKTVDEQTLLTFTASAADPDLPANTLTFSLSGAPSGAVIISSTGVFSWTPDEDQGAGVYSFDVIVSDDGSPALSDSETITVTVNEVNRPPVLSAIGNKTVNEQSLLSFTAIASDPDLRPANALTFSLSGAPTNASIAPTSGYFTWTPTENEGPGSYTFDVIVSDNGSPVLSDSETITVAVYEVNSPPVLTSIGDQTVDEGNQLSFTASATDPDVPPNALSFSLSSAPSGANITSGGDFTWTPTEAQGPGVYTAVVAVQDDGSPVMTDSETITVTVNEVNTAPVLAAIGNRSVDEEETLTFTLSAADTDIPANGFVYGMNNAPAGAALNSSSGLFQWTPTFTQGPGVYAVTFVVTDTGSPPLTDSETIDITVVEIADVSVNKTAAPASVVAGSSTLLIYTLNVANSGPSMASNVLLTDTLPAGVTVSFVTPTQGSCGQASNLVTCTLGNLARSGAENVTIGVTVDSPTTGNLLNTAEISNDVIDRVQSNNSDSATTTVATRADLILSKSDSADPVLLFDPLTYTLTITNDGPSDATGVTLSDTLPVSVTFAAASTGCAESGGAVSCALGTLTAGSTQVVSVVVTPTATGLLNNQAAVSSSVSDPATGNNSAAETTTILPKADLSISKNDFPDPVAALDTLTYTLTIVNNGPSNAPGVVVTDTLPLTAAIVSVTPMTTAQSGQELYWHLGTLNNAASSVITIVVSPQAIGTLQNTAAVGSAIADPVANNNTAAQQTAVTTRVDLAVAKSASANPVTAGTLLTYTLTVSNYGPSQGTSIVVSDTLPSGVSFVSAPGCSENGGVVACSLSNLSPGDAVSAAVTVKVNSSTAGVLTNAVRVRGYEFDPDAANNTASIATGVIVQADLSLSKTASPSPAIAGDTLTYTLVIANNGPSDAGGALLTDTLPFSLNLVSAVSTQGSCSGQSVIVCNPGAINSGESVTVTLVTLVNAAKRGTLNNTAIVGSASDDPLPGNNTAALQSSVNALSDLGLSIRDSADPVVAGNQLTYHLSITNAGPSKATNLVLTDSPPLSASLNSLAASQGSCSGTNPISCNLGDLSPDESAAVTITLTIDESFSGQATNSASVSADESDPNSNNNTAAEETSVKPSTYYIFLPLVIKSPPPRTELSVFNDNAGGDITFSVLGTNVSCTVPNNTTQYCGSFSPGTYTVRVVAPCGTAETQKTYADGPQTTRVYCN